MPELYNYNAVVIKVVDGDTVDLNVDCGFNIWHKIRTRLIGINAPERGQTGWHEANEHLRLLLPIDTPCVVQTYKTAGDKYGRWLATIFNSDGINVNEDMLNSMNAVPYTHSYKPRR